MGKDIKDIKELHNKGDKKISKRKSEEQRLSEAADKNESGHENNRSASSSTKDGITSSFLKGMKSINSDLGNTLESILKDSPETKKLKADFQLSQEQAAMQVESIRKTLDEWKSKTDPQSDIDQNFKDISAKINENLKEVVKNIEKWSKKFNSVMASRDIKTNCLGEIENINKLATDFQDKISAFLTEIAAINRQSERYKNDLSIDYNKIIGKDDKPSSTNEFQETLNQIYDDFKRFSLNFSWESYDRASDMLSKIDKQISTIHKNKEFADECCDSYNKMRTYRQIIIDSRSFLKKAIDQDLCNRLIDKSPREINTIVKRYKEYHNRILRREDLLSKSTVLEEATKFYLNDIISLAEKEAAIKEIVEQIKDTSKLDQFKKALSAGPSADMLGDLQAQLSTPSETPPQYTTSDSTISGEAPPEYVTQALLSMYHTKQLNWTEHTHNQEQLEELLTQCRDHWTGSWWDRPTLLNSVTAELYPTNVLRAVRDKMELIDTGKRKRFLASTTKERVQNFLLGVKEFLGRPDLSQQEKDNTLRQDLQDAGLLSKAFLYYTKKKGN